MQRKTYSRVNVVYKIQMPLQFNRGRDINALRMSRLRGGFKFRGSPVVPFPRHGFCRPPPSHYTLSSSGPSTYLYPREESVFDQPICLLGYCGLLGHHLWHPRVPAKSPSAQAYRRLPSSQYHFDSRQCYPSPLSVRGSHSNTMETRSLLRAL